MQEITGSKQGELRFPRSGCRRGPVLTANADHRRVWMVTGYNGVLMALCQTRSKPEKNDEYELQELHHAG
jgi:hypothetical protein